MFSSGPTVRAKARLCPKNGRGHVMCLDSTTDFIHSIALTEFEVKIKGCFADIQKAHGLDRCLSGRHPRSCTLTSNLESKLRARQQHFQNLERYETCCPGVSRSLHILSSGRKTRMDSCSCSHTLKNTWCPWNVLWPFKIVGYAYVVLEPFVLKSHSTC